MKVLVWNMELLKYGMEDFINGMKRIFHTSIHFPYLLILLLFLSAVNEATFDHTLKIIKKSSSQRSIQINKVGKEKGS